jgi:MFS family permease
MGSLTLSSYSGFCERLFLVHLRGHLTSHPDGRRPIYLYSLPVLCAGSIGLARSSSVWQLLACGAVQALGSSGGLSVGSGVIGDIYKLEERGRAMGVFFSVCPFVLDTIFVLLIF